MRSACESDWCWRQARPLLGTLVEIFIGGREEDLLIRAADLGFRRIEKIQRLMSAHEEGSELSRLNREAYGREVTVSPETFEVLSIAWRIFEESEGVFDVTVGTVLHRLGYLSGKAMGGVGTTREIELLEGNRVQFRCPLRIDFGGIAKGYAVDRAVEVLKGEDIPWGVVNAGGDLRVFGKVQEVEIRNPLRWGELAGSLRLHEKALATSASYFSGRREGGRSITPWIQPFDGQCVDFDSSVSILAAEAVWADALTKVAILAGQKADPVLRKFHAEKIIIPGNRFGR